MLSCVKFREFKEWQLSRLDKHIHDNQYFLGEKANHSIEWYEAEYDFFMQYNEKVGCELRAEYCSSICSARDGCILGKKFSALVIDMVE
jgi:hypothetical protein